MVNVYYGLIKDETVPPTQDEFVEAYLDLVWMSSALRGWREAIRYRAERGYPSFVRQHHAELVLRSAFPWTFRSSHADQRGVDLLVVHGGEVLGVALSVNTEAARVWSHTKAKRQLASGPPPFDILTFFCDQQEHVVGEFWLHNPEWLIANIQERLSR